MPNERKEELKLYTLQVKASKDIVVGAINPPMDNTPENITLIDSYLNNVTPSNDALAVFLSMWRNKTWLIEGATSTFSIVDILALFDPLSQIGVELPTYIINAQSQGLLHEIFYETPGEDTSAYVKFTDGQKKYVNTASTGLQNVFTFRVNPNHLNIQKKKLFTKIRTKGGFEFQHWGADISEIALEGVTGNIRASGIGLRDINLGVTSVPVPVDRALEEFPNEQNSSAYKTFRALEKLYEDDQNDNMITNNIRLALEYRKRIYVGHLSQFSYTEIADKPFMFEYKLTFLVHYEATSEVGAVSQASGDIVRNEETLQRIRQIQEDINRSIDQQVRNASSNSSNP